MNDLVNALKIVLGDSFSLYFKAHTFHWNVQGPDFKQYHLLFDDVYNQAFGDIDEIAEHIRALDAFAPSSVAELRSLSTIQEEVGPPDAMTMVRKLLSAVDLFEISLHKAYAAAEAASEVGVSNFLQDKIDAWKKTAWMLRATTR
jgi:starvation-inducible DNA-binding protein